MHIRSGNFDDMARRNPKTRGWVVGHFMSNDPFFQTDDVEVKWSRHPKGEQRDGHATTSTTRTFGVLISGKYVIRFPSIGKEVVLSQVGDFCAFDAHEGPHASEALEDTALLTIRWPSKREDHQ